MLSTPTYNSIRTLPNQIPLRTATKPNRDIVSHNESILPSFQPSFDGRYLGTCSDRFYGMYHEIGEGYEHVVEEGGVDERDSVEARMVENGDFEDGVVEAGVGRSLNNAPTNL